MAKKAKINASNYIWGVTRISLGLVFFWAFVDKLFGLGFATCRGKDGLVSTFCDSAWINGGSPTKGFLKFGTEGSPLESTFQAMAGNAIWDWLFMIGLGAIGLALILGIGMKIATYSGALLLGFMYLAMFQPENNPVIDDHIIYVLVLLGLCHTNDSQALGFGKWWKKQGLVKRYPILE